MSATPIPFEQQVPSTPFAGRQISIAIAGNPNAGKTSLFNALTGLRQKVANYPGVTVETKRGFWNFAENLPPASLIDLPGLYSLDTTSIDEQIAGDVLLGRSAKISQPEVVIVAVDATNLTRNLYLAVQLIESGCNVVIALTMVDMAERQRIKIDVGRLSERLGVPVVPVVTRQNRGLKDLAQAVWESLDTGRVNNPEPKTEKPDWPESIFSRYRKVERIVAGAMHHENSERPTLTERIDAVVTHRFFGPLILVGIMLLIFQTIFSWASLPMNLIERLFGWSGSIVEAYLPPGLVADLLVNGVIAGVGGVLVFLPQILLLFFFISLLEDSGYMSRAAFLMDRLMRTFGLHGKSFMPLMSSFACAVPGIMATRTIENPKDRLVTIMVAPFMSCSARLPVYTLMIATFFAEQKMAGLVSMGVLVMLGMYVLGISVALVAASIMKHTMTNVPSPPFVMELPAYRLPDPRNVIQAIWGRVTVFVKRAGTVILAISILLWALTAFPRQSRSAQNSAEQIRGSYAGQIGVMLEPAIRPLGFDWSIGIGLISSFVARETIISTLGIVHSTGDTALPEAMRDARRSDGTKVWTPLVALSLMIFFVLACQCTSTLAVVKRETNSWRWPLFMIAYMMALAYVASLITYQGGRLLGFS